MFNALTDQCLGTLHTRLALRYVTIPAHSNAAPLISGDYSVMLNVSSWQLAEWIVERTPDGIQHLLERARWDVDVARDILRDYYYSRTLHCDMIALTFFPKIQEEPNTITDWQKISTDARTKGECSPDHYEIRRWQSWHQHIKKEKTEESVERVLQWSHWRRHQYCAQQYHCRRRGDLYFTD
uniref:hypothetical protein n=1 Tax=Xenorhabdus doucetiae TaxID=351671 RepID=UPI0038CD6653